MEPLVINVFIPSTAALHQQQPVFPFIYSRQRWCHYSPALDVGVIASIASSSSSAFVFSLLRCSSSSSCGHRTSRCVLPRLFARPPTAADPGLSRNEPAARSWRRIADQPPTRSTAVPAIVGDRGWLPLRIVKRSRKTACCRPHTTMTAGHCPRTTERTTTGVVGGERVGFHPPSH
jgi:hypothetical protein